MKAVVLRQFKDKQTKQIYKEKQIIEKDVKRLKEINSTSFGKLVEIDKQELKQMTKKELIQIANDIGIELNESMKKDEILMGLMKWI